MIKCALQFQRKSNQHCPNHYFTIIIHKSNQIKCWFLMRGENRSTRGKTSHERVEDQQTQFTYYTECGNRTRATLVEGKCSHHQANPATTCLRQVVQRVVTLSNFGWNTKKPSQPRHKVFISRAPGRQNVSRILAKRLG